MNPAHETHWLPGLLALGCALLAAIVFLLSSRRKHTPVAPASSAEDLGARYQGIIAELKEHAANRHLYAAEAWATEQARLEQAAAAVLRERAGVAHEDLKAQARAAKRVEAQTTATGFFARNPAFKGALWGGGVVLFFVALGVLLSRESKDRADGEQITGMAAGGSGAPMKPQPPQEDPVLKAALERAERSPEDIDALAAASRELISRQLFEDAAPLVSRATMLDPYHVPTRIHRAILLATEGQTATALDELQHLADTFEGAYDARLYAGFLSMQAEDKPRALAQFERYLDEAPAAEQPVMLRSGIAQLRAEIAHQGKAPAP